METAGAGALRAGALVASLSAIGRVWTVAGAEFCGASFGDAAGEGATRGASMSVAMGCGAPRSTAGESTVPQAVASATSNRLAEIVFIIANE